VAADSGSDPDAIRALYDRLSPTFLRFAGPTFQAGLVRRADGSEDPAWSNRALADRAGVRLGDRILDAGCGVGGPACDIAAAFPQTQVEGLTVSGVQVGMATNRARQAGLSDRVRFTEGDFHALPFPDCAFDVVLYLESSEYSPALDLLFSEAARVVRPGGVVYAKGAFRREGPLSEQQEADLAEYDAMWAISRTPSPSEIGSAMANAGLRVEEPSWLELGSGHFIGSMFELGSDGLKPNRFGEALFRRFIDLPVGFAQVRAVRPE
jgi:cyclopropane fatty-acyl-phospholipid synthase-like methyltransferase